MSCTRSQSACNYHCPGDRTGDLSAGCGNHKQLSVSNVKQLTKVDSGYCSNMNIQQASSTIAPQSSQQWGAASSVSSSVYTGDLGMPASYSSEGLHYVPIPSFKPQCAGLIDLPHQGDMQSLLAGRSLLHSQLAQQYLGPQAPLHPGAYHVGATGNGLFSVSSTGMFFLSSFINIGAEFCLTNEKYPENVVKQVTMQHNGETPNVLIKIVLLSSSIFFRHTQERSNSETCPSHIRSSGNSWGCWVTLPPWTPSEPAGHGNDGETVQSIWCRVTGGRWS